MSRFWRMLAFVVVSIIEVEVQAATWITLSEAQDPVQLPESCLLESSICSVRTLAGQRFTMAIGTHEVVLGSQSVFSRLSASSGSLISGMAMIRAQTGFALETPYGKVLSDGGEFLIFREGTRFVVSALKGDVRLLGRGYEKALQVKPGMENWISRVNSKGKAEVGIPRVMDFKAVLGQVAPLFSGGRDKFSAFAHEMRMSWRESVELSSVTYEAMVDRELASQAQKERDAAAAQRRWESERNHWRKILWDRNFE